MTFNQLIDTHMLMLPFYYNTTLMIILENDVVMKTNKRLHKFSTHIIMEKIWLIARFFSLGTTYSKGCWNEMKLSIQPSVSSSIHGSHHTRKNTLAKINTPPPPPLCMCRCLGKACPAPRGSDINIKPKGPNTPWRIPRKPENCHY